MNTANQFSKKAPKILFYGFVFFTLAKAVDYLFYGLHVKDLVSAISFAFLALGFFRIDTSGGREDRTTVTLLVVGLALGIGQILMRYIA